MLVGVTAAAAVSGARRYRRHDENGIREFSHGAVVSAMRRLKRASHFDVKYDEFGIPMYKFQDGATLQFVSAGNSSTSGQQEFRPILQPGNDKRAAAQRYDSSANTAQGTGGGDHLVQVQPFVVNNGNSGGDLYVFGSSPLPVNMFHQTPPPYGPPPPLAPPPPIASPSQSYALPPPPPYAAPPPPPQAPTTPPYAPAPAQWAPNTMLGYALKPPQPAANVARTCTPNSHVLFVLYSIV